MKYFSFKILILFILLPPLLYTGTVNLLEAGLAHRYYRQVKNVYLSEIVNILSGLTPVKEEIADSIQTLLTKNLFVRLGGRLEITVTNPQGSILYPATRLNRETGPGAINPLKLAEDNFKALSKGLEVRVETEIRPFSLLAVLILSFYILSFLGALYLYYRRVNKRIEREYRDKTAELDRLRILEQEREAQIRFLSEKRASLLSDYQKLKQDLTTEKNLAKKTEDQLFDEIEALEARLNENLAQQQQQHEETERLHEKIQDLEKNRENLARQKKKASDRLEKRFRALYKNIDITLRAIEGIDELTEEMGLKAEEVIHRLNDDPETVPVKRKVFSKGGKVTAFEVTFAYNGRLYYRRSGQNRIEILTVGTKNTQTKDMTYIQNL